MILSFKNYMSGVYVVDYGDVPILPTHTKTNMMMIRDTFKKIVDRDVFPVAFGGDHTITFPVIQAFDVPIDIVHFDTHLDFVDGAENMKFSHSNPIKGFRTGNCKQHNTNWNSWIHRYGGLLRRSLELRLKDYNYFRYFSEWFKWVLDQILIICNVTFDIDVLDPSLAPGTGTLEPGGLSYLQIKEILTKIPKRRR